MKTWLQWRRRCLKLRRVVIVSKQSLVCVYCFCYNYKLFPLCSSLLETQLNVQRLLGEDTTNKLKTALASCQVELDDLNEFKERKV